MTSSATVYDTAGRDDGFVGAYEEEEEEEEPVILEKETAETESCRPDKIKRSLPVGDTKGKKEKSKAQKQKSVKDANAAKVKKDKAPKSKPS